MTLSHSQYGETFNHKGVSVFFGDSNSKKLIEQENIQFGHQVHKDDLIEVHSPIPHSSHLMQGSDGLFTDKKNLKLGLYTADCIPCFLYSRQRLFSLHLGWRSLHMGLLDKALKSINKSEELLIFTGPHIKFSSFEVGNDVLLKFKEVLKNSQDKSWYRQVSDTKFKISLQQIIQIKAVGYNVDFFSSKVDTYTSKSHCSYRKQKGTKERNISFAFLK